MRSTTTDKKTNPKTSQRKSRAIQMAASALAVTASLAGAGALADHKGYNSNHYDNGHHKQRDHRQDYYRYGPIYQQQQRTLRVHIPVRDHGPEVLPLGRLIKQNSHVDLNRYRLVAVETKNGRFSNGFASLRTGNSRTERYFLGSRDVTRIPAPSRADSTWRLRLGPGTQVRSVTAVLKPRHGWAHRKPANRRHASDYNRNHQTAQSTPWLGLALLLANADDDNRDRKQHKRMKKLRAEQARTEAELAAAERKLDRSRQRNKRLKDQRSRLAEELAHERVESRPGKRGKADKDRKRSSKRERHSEREVKRTVRYVVSAN